MQYNFIVAMLKAKSTVGTFLQSEMFFSAALRRLSVCLHLSEMIVDDGLDWFSYLA